MSKEVEQVQIRLKKSLLKALQEGEITPAEAREIVNSCYSIPMEFWSGETTKIRPEAYTAVFGLLPCITWINTDTNEEGSSMVIPENN